MNELDAASPTYKKARRVFSDFSSLENAQQLGLDFTKRTPEEIRRILSKMDNSQKEAFKIGVRENLQRTVNKTADQADPAKRVFGNKFKRDQLQAVFGEGKQFNEFSKRMNEEIAAAKTKFNVLGGSRTDINLTDDTEFIEALADGARRGVIATTIDRSVGAASDALKRRFTGLTTKSSRDLARILTNREAGIDALEDLIAKAPENQKNLLRDAANEFQVLLAVGAAR